MGIFEKVSETPPPGQGASSARRPWGHRRLTFWTGQSRTGPGNPGAGQPRLMPTADFSLVGLHGWPVFPGTGMDFHRGIQLRLSASHGAPLRRPKPREAPR